jgi:hypothetical protein
MDQDFTMHVIKQIEDFLTPRLKLDAYERSIYYHVLRHSRLIGKGETVTSIQQLMDSLNCSKNVTKTRLKSLAEKGLVKITDTGWSGTKISVLLPSEIHGVLPEEKPDELVDIENIDFYSDTRYRKAIFDREDSRCFYCFRILTSENSGLDHIEPQINGEDNSYRNVVAACHSCNSSKGSTSADDYLRGLYRRGLLSSDEFEERRNKIQLIKNGAMKPDI